MMEESMRFEGATAVADANPASASWPHVCGCARYEGGEHEIDRSTAWDSSGEAAFTDICRVDPGIAAVGDDIPYTPVTLVVGVVGR